jgi:hypothetical protein
MIIDSSEKHMWSRDSKPFYGLGRGRLAKGKARKFERPTPGGFEDISYVTRFTPATSFVIREDTRRRTSGGKTYLRDRQMSLGSAFASVRSYQSAVMKSSDVTARRVITYRCESAMSDRGKKAGLPVHRFSCLLGHPLPLPGEARRTLD